MYMQQRYIRCQTVQNSEIVFLPHIYSSYLQRKEGEKSTVTAYPPLVCLHVPFPTLPRCTIIEYGFPCSRVNFLAKTQASAGQLPLLAAAHRVHLFSLLAEKSEIGETEGKKGLLYFYFARSPLPC